MSRVKLKCFTKKQEEKNSNITRDKLASSWASYTCNVCMVASIYSKPRVIVSLNWRRVHIQGLCDTYCHLKLLLAPRGSRRGLKDSRSVKTS